MSSKSRQERRYLQRMEKVNRKKRLWKSLLFIFMGTLILLFVLSGIAVASIIHSAPAFGAGDLETPLSTLIYDNNGDLIGTVFHEENRIKVNAEDIPDQVFWAVISTEDKRFYEHHGVDYRRIFGAALANIKRGWGTEGGSTITQQVIKQSVLTPEKTLTRKIQEAWLARKLENTHSKEQIMEIYLNNIYFGQGAYGIKTAAETYFGTDDLTKLDISQIALLVGLPNAPSAFNPIKHPDRAEKRRNQVLTAMVNNKVIAQQEADDAMAQSVSDILYAKKPKTGDSLPNSAFLDTVYEQLVHQEKIITEEEFYQGGLEIYTTLDSKAQQAVYDLLHSEELPYPDDDFETGIALVDTKTGAIKAIGGGRNFKAISYKNYGSEVGHHPGSTIKPILDYGPAIEYLKWSTAHIINDEPYHYSDGTPINEWDNRYWGNVTIRRALEWSRNIPALKTFQAVGAENAQIFARKLGIDIDPLYESASIGSFEEGASPLQMAGAYAAFGNGGIYHKPFTVKKMVYPDGKEWLQETYSETVMQDYTAYMITDMLKTVITSGTGTLANIPDLPVAGKTGTTNIAKETREKYGIANGVRDSWFVGYTPKDSLAIWTGYPSLTNKKGDVRYIRDKETQDIAKHIFKELMTFVSDPNMEDFVKPESVIQIGPELYIQGTDPYQIGNESEQEKNHEPIMEEQEPEEDGQEEEQEQESDAEQNEESEDEPDTDNNGDREEEKEQNEEEPVDDMDPDDDDGQNGEDDDGEEHHDQTDPSDGNVAFQIKGLFSWGIGSAFFPSILPNYGCGNMLP